MEKRTAQGRCIALIGLPASGKTSIGSALARRLGLPFVDLDEQIVAAEGRPIAEIFRVDGEGAFRQLESDFLARATKGGKVVISTGGGCILDPANRNVLSDRCTVVWLDLSPEAAAARVESGGRKAGDGKSAGKKPAPQADQAPAVRPLLADGDILERMKALDAIRRPLYRECAEIVIHVEGKIPATIVEELYAAMD